MQAQGGVGIASNMGRNGEEEMREQHVGGSLNTLARALLYRICVGDAVIFKGHHLHYMYFFAEKRVHNNKSRGGYGLKAVGQRFSRPCSSQTLVWDRPITVSWMENEAARG